jgi:glycosyltransferase 2 family protein
MNDSAGLCVEVDRREVGVVPPLVESAPHPAEPAARLAERAPHPAEPAARPAEPAARPAEPAARPAQPAAEVRRSSRSAVRRLFVLSLFSVALVTAVLAVPTLGSVRSELDSIDGWWGAAAVALEVASCVSFVFVFRVFFETVAPGVARGVAWLEEGSGALLPGGGLTSYAIGGLVLNREGLTVRDIVVRSGGLFWFTSAVNALALVIGTALLLFVPERSEPSLLVIVLPLAVGGPLALVIAATPVLGRVRRAPARNLVDGVAYAWRAAGRRNWRLLGALGYLYFDMFVLLCLFRGVGYDVSLGALSLGYLVGYLATLIPVPGGIGVLEGGLAGALILYGAPPVKTVAVVLVYHAIAFWIPSLGGVAGYLSLVRRGRRRAPRTEPTVASQG